MIKVMENEQIYMNQGNYKENYINNYNGNEEFQTSLILSS